MLVVGRRSQARASSLPSVSRSKSYDSLATLGDFEREMNGARINFFELLILLDD